MPSGSEIKTVNTVLFDFGGVLADEGFRDGLAAIGKLSGLSGEDIVVKGHELVVRQDMSREGEGGPLVGRPCAARQACVDG